DLVDVHDPALGPLDVVVRRLQQPQDDVLDVFADVARFGQRRRVGDGERDVEHLGQRLGEQRLAGAGGTDEQDVRLLQLDVARRGARLDALVVIVDRDGQDLLRAILTDHVLIEDVLDLRGLGKAPELTALLLFPLLRDDVVAEIDALVADVNGGAGDQLADVVLALPAEGALERPAALTGARHASYSYAVTATAASGTGRVVGFEEITSSTMWYSLACSAVMKKSRSVSRWIFSMESPVWWTRMRFSSSRIRRISRAWMSMSVA